MARYRQALVEVQEKQSSPFSPEIAWRQFNEVSY